MSTSSTIAKRAAFITGAAISFLAGYISVCGLAALFPSGVVVLAMGAGLTLAKVVLVSCWRHTTGLIRVGLSALVLLLVSIDLVGVSAFLISAHRGDAAPALAAAAQADRLAADLVLARAEQAQAEARLKRLDDAVGALPPTWVTRAQELRASQAGERAEVQAALQAALADQRRILSEQAAARTVQASAELAPVRYAAKALQLSDERAVNMMILLLVLGFDPSGLVLVAIGSGSRQQRQQPARAGQSTPRRPKRGLGRGLAELTAEQEEVARQRPQAVRLRIVG